VFLAYWVRWVRRVEISYEACALFAAATDYDDLYLVLLEKVGKQSGRLDYSYLASRRG